jgi:hypothetical protein
VIAMPRRFLAFPLLAVLLAASAAQAQAPAGKPADARQDLRKLCETVSMTPADAREMARRSECVLSGVLPSPNRVAEARALARSAIAAGEPSGGLMLYLAFLDDPAYQFMRNGKVDAEAYGRLAARPIAQRQDQVDAIDGLGLAAGKNNRAAGVLLAGYFHETLAPRNVARVGALSALLMREGERTPLLERYAREADAIAKTAPATKASVRSFLETYPEAVAAAQTGYRAQSGGKTCDKPQLKSVSSGDIAGAEFLPLRGNMVQDSYLVKGQWSEYWSFLACGEEVPVKVGFVADGLGGATTTVRHNKGD